MTAGTLKRSYWTLVVWVGAMVLLCSLTFGPVPSTAAVVWVDDFNDGNYNGWTVRGFLKIDGGILGQKKTEGNFSAADSTLRATGEPANVKDTLWNLAEHPSSVAYGTWSFDVNAMDIPEHHFYVFFMINDWETFPESTYGYCIYISPKDAEFKLMKLAGDARFIKIPLDRYQFDLAAFSGWQHIDVTRDTDGQFYVYINGTLRLEAVDTEITTSTNFRFGSETGPALDNVIVSDTVDITPAPATPEWLTISIGVPVVLVVIGAVWKWKHRRVS